MKPFPHPLLIFCSNLISCHSYHLSLHHHLLWLSLRAQCVRWISVTLGKWLLDLAECALWPQASWLWVTSLPCFLLFPRSLVTITEKETVLDTNSKNKHNELIVFIVMSTFWSLESFKWRVSITTRKGKNMLKTYLYTVLQKQRLKFLINFL